MFDPNDIPDVSVVGDPATDEELGELSRTLGDVPPELARVLQVANGVTADIVQFVLRLRCDLRVSQRYSAA